MSFMRPGHPLRYFMGLSKSYVWSDYDHIIEDYSDDYKNNMSFVELVGRFAKRSTEDEQYSIKIMQVLAAKLGCLDKMRKHKLTREEQNVEEKMLDNIYAFQKEHAKHGCHAERALISADMYYDLEDIMNDRIENYIVERVYSTGHLTEEEYVAFLNERTNKLFKEK
jgi:hypothetical protein